MDLQTVDEVESPRSKVTRDPWQNTGSQGKYTMTPNRVWPLRNICTSAVGEADELMKDDNDPEKGHCISNSTEDAASTLSERYLQMTPSQSSEVGTLILGLPY